MRGIAIGIALTSLFCTTQSYAQQELMGKYEATISGTTQTGRHAGRTWTQYLILEITGAENGKIAGKLNQSRGFCDGDYLIEGTFKDGKLEMRTSEGSKVDCGKVPIVLAPQEKKLVGTYGRTRVEFSKQ